MNQDTTHDWRGRTLIVLLCITALLSALYSNGYTDQSKEVVLLANLTRREVAEVIGEKLGWNEQDRINFESTYVQMQWATWNKVLLDILDEQLAWSPQEEETFLTTSTLQFSGPELDVLSSVYEPGTYRFKSKDSLAVTAGVLIDRVKEKDEDLERTFIKKHLAQTAVTNIDHLVTTYYDLLPDLVPSPPLDLKLEREGARVNLRFSTVYYNQGKGPLELIADPATRGIKSDLERNVFQIIQKEDGTTRQRTSGTFLWHQEHLHYHFADFITYDLELVATKGTTPDLSGLRTKSTFCIRDISRTDLVLPNRPKDAAYKICGKEKQGISVGWGDSYFYNYPDQLLNVTDLPPGTYKLTFNVNPESLFEEARRDNNTSSVTFTMDPSILDVQIIEQTPKTTPKLEHMYLEQDL